MQIQVSQPNVIKACNEAMRGVDMMNRLLESYRPGRAMKKLLFLFVNILNVIVIATCSPFHLQCCNLDSKVTHSEFRSYPTLMLIKSEDENRINQEQCKNNPYADLWKNGWKLTGSNEKQGLTMNGTINQEHKKKIRLKKLDLTKKRHLLSMQFRVKWV